MDSKERKAVGNIQDLIQLKKDRIIQKQARIAIIGLGYAGLPLLCDFALQGFPVVGIDKDKDRIRLLQKNMSPFPDVKEETLVAISKQVCYTDLYAELQQCDVSIICVPTPLKDQYPDLSIVVEVGQGLRKVMPEGHLVILESTTYPGTTTEVLLPLLGTPSYVVGTNFFLGYSPERVDPGNAVFNLKNTPKIVSGVTPECSLLTQMVYAAVADSVVVVSSPAVAEAAKVLENTYRFINIALANEFAVFCNELQLNVWEVIEAAATKPYGFTPFWPGLGVGGHCIPIDPHYLSWKARQHGTPLHMVEVARDTNERMPEFVLQRISDTLNSAHRTLLKTHILVLGVTYKPDVPDVREAPPLSLIQKLLRKGACVSYHDPFIPSLQLNGTCLCCVPSLEEALESAELVVVATNHSQYDWEMIAQKASLIFDTRGVYRYLAASHIVLL